MFAKSPKFDDTKCNYSICYHIMQIIRGGKLSQFSRISLQMQRFSSEIFFFHIIRCLELLYNCKSFSANKKIMQPRNFSTVNDLHYTVFDMHRYIASYLPTLHSPVTDHEMIKYWRTFTHLATYYVTSVDSKELVNTQIKVLQIK